MRSRGKFPNTHTSHANQSSFVDNDVCQENLDQSVMNKVVQEMYLKYMKGKEVLESPI